MSKQVTGVNIDMGDLVYEPPRDGPTLWEIGFPDRTAAEFYIPDPDPKYANSFLLDNPNRLVIILVLVRDLINLVHWVCTS